MVQKMSISPRSQRIGAVLILILLIIWGGWRVLTHDQKATITVEAPDVLPASQPIEVPIIVDTLEDTINAAEIYLTFDPSVMRVESISKEPSFFTIWLDKQPAFSNESGEISLAGGLPTPGFKGRSTVGTVTLTPLKKGTITLTFDPKTRILKNDGLGTTVPLTMPPITRIIQ